MKTRPILFSPAMVQAVLDGRKTQTRRIIKEMQVWTNEWEVRPVKEEHMDGIPRYEIRSGSRYVLPLLKCPYGRPGDILWVREEHYRFGHWIEKEGIFTLAGRQKWKFIALTDEVLYDPPESFRRGMHNKDPHTPAWHKRLARFMPRSACRLYLRNTGVRGERLQVISEEDAIAEGIEYVVSSMVNGYRYYGSKPSSIIEAITDSPIESFHSLWQSINGPESWQASTWVWVIKFERTEKPVNL